jgi:hypothetical protein
VSGNWQIFNAMLTELLTKHGLGPGQDPEFYDQAQRAAPVMWEAGLSVHEIVNLLTESHRSAVQLVQQRYARCETPERRSLSWERAWEELRARYVPPAP